MGVDERYDGCPVEQEGDVNGTLRGRDGRCVAWNRPGEEASRNDSSRVRVPAKVKAGASGRVEWVVVGRDGLVRNVKVELGLLEPID